MGVGSGVQGARGIPWHGTDIADRGLKVLFSVFFGIFAFFFPLAPLEEA